MALRPCPECRAKISSAATSCPHCGYPLVDDDDDDDRPAKSSGIGRWLAFGCLGVVLLGACGGVLLIGIPFLQKVREAEHKGPLKDGGGGFVRKEEPKITKEQTLAYWMSMKNLYFSTGLANSANKNFDYKAAAVSLRQVSRKLDEMNADGVDPEAIACNKSMSDLLQKTAPLLDKVGALVARPGEDPTFVLQGMFDTSGLIKGVTGEVQEVRKQAEGVREVSNKVEVQIRRTRSTLTKRYNAEFPLLMPPVIVVLQPFLIQNGYYVVVLNSSSEPLSATVTYVEAGKTQQTGVLQPSGNIRLDPSTIGHRVAANQRITVSTDGYSYTYDVNALLPK